MISSIKRSIFALSLIFWSASTFASGWNDFSRDIGHGFKLVKMSSFEVCIGFLDRGGLIVCPDSDEGDFGPVSDFVFTDNHLLVRTHGAKPDIDFPGHFETDITKEHYFIIKKQINNPYYFQPTGPLSSQELYANPIVPADLEWERATRFASSTDDSFIFSVLAILVMMVIAPFIIFNSFFGVPVVFSILLTLLFLVVLAVFRRRRRRNLSDA